MRHVQEDKINVVFLNYKYPTGLTGRADQRSAGVAPEMDYREHTIRHQ